MENRSMPLHDAVSVYFAGERFEMILIVAGSLIAMALAAWLFLELRDGFATGFASTTLLAALLLGATAVTLLVRDAHASPVMVAAVEKAGMNSDLVGQERTRIAKVIANYPAYRYAAAGLLLVALGLLLLTTSGWTHGIASALLLTVAAQIVIDHYSERRVRIYAEQLQSPSGGTASLN